MMTQWLGEDLIKKIWPSLPPFSLERNLLTAETRNLGKIRLKSKFSKLNQWLAENLIIWPTIQSRKKSFHLQDTLLTIWHSYPSFDRRRNSLERYNLWRQVIFTSFTGEEIQERKHQIDISWCKVIFTPRDWFQNLKLTSSALGEWYH